MLQHYDTKQIADFWLPALINGDITGLNDHEVEQLDQWVSALPDCCTFDCDNEGGFCIDDISGLYALCFEVKIYFYC